MQGIEDLEKTSKSELLARWRELPGKRPPPARIDRLIRELAYRLQEEACGKLDKNTAVSLRRHMTVFEKSLREGRPVPAAKTPSRIALEPGSVITRQWEGRTLTIQILEARQFEFEGSRYKSLSAIAKKITGQHLSGPLFFGLKEVSRG